MSSSVLANIFSTGITTVPQMRQAAKTWARNNKGMPARQFEQIITAFMKHPSVLKKCMGGILLGYMPPQRQMIAPSMYDSWLEHAVGWA